MEPQNISIQLFHGHTKCSYWGQSRPNNQLPGTLGEDIFFQKPFVQSQNMNHHYWKRNINKRKTPILIWLYEWFSNWFFCQGLVTIDNSIISKEVVTKQKNPLKAALPCSWRKVQLCFYFTLALFIWENDANGFHLRYCGKILQVVFIWCPRWANDANGFHLRSGQNIAGGFQPHFQIAKCLQKHLDQDWGNQEIQKAKFIFPSILHIWDFNHSIWEKNALCI